MLKGLIAVALLAFMLVPGADAACLKDAKGEVICGAGQCARDQRGDVYCASLRFGSAFRTRDGWISCGTGQCTATRDGNYVCSDVEGGVPWSSRWRGRCGAKVTASTPPGSSASEFRPDADCPSTP